MDTTKLMQEVSDALRDIADNKGSKTVAKSLVKRIYAENGPMFDKNETRIVTRALEGAFERLVLWVGGEINNAAAIFCADQLDAALDPYMTENGIASTEAR